MYWVVTRSGVRLETHFRSRRRPRPRRHHPRPPATTTRLLAPRTAAPRAATARRVAVVTMVVVAVAALAGLLAPGARGKPSPPLIAHGANGTLEGTENLREGTDNLREGTENFRPGIGAGAGVMIAGHARTPRLAARFAGVPAMRLGHEQSQVWPRLEDALTATASADLAEQWRTVRAGAATRPHPHLLSDPTLLGLMMPVLAFVDRRVAALRGRIPLTGA